MKFKRTCKAMLKEENYLDALAFFCERLIKIPYIEDRERELLRIDSVLWNMACDTDIENAMEQEMTSRHRLKQTQGGQNRPPLFFSLV